MKNSIEVALDIAKKVHQIPNNRYPDGQKDKLAYPYMAHILDIASRVSHLGLSYEIVGLLHDSIEDADLSIQSDIETQVKESFSNEIIEAIYAMTKNSHEDYFKDYLPRLSKNKIARQVKIADSSHNLSKAHLIKDEELQNKLRNKYIQVLNQLGVDGTNCEKPIFFNNNKWQVLER